MANIPIIGQPGSPTTPTGPNLPVGKVSSRVELLVEINTERKKKGLPEIVVPPPEPGRPLEPPLRIEIEQLLGRVPHNEDPALHNAEHERIIREYMEVNYPGRRDLCSKVLEDLMSYRHWRLRRA